MKTLKTLFMFLFTLIAVSPSTYAETIQARVKQIDADLNTITISPSKEQNKFPKEIHFYIEENQLKGIASLSDLKVGDEVKVDADRTAQGFQLESLSRAYVKAPTAAFDTDTSAYLGPYKWSDKLKRGAWNIVSSPVEIARSIYLGTREQNLAYGWTVGLIRGVGQGVVRFGAGVVDVVTFPFDFPVDGKAPLIQPEYVWEKPGVDYA